MSVISLSSEDEDEYIILDSDDEDSGDRSSQTHQVFIVEGNQSCSFNEAALPNFTNRLEEPTKSYNCDNNIINISSISVVNSCQTLPITNISTKKKSESSLKLLAEKLAKVLVNEYTDVAIDQFDKANPETNTSRLEKTIFDVSRGIFTIQDKGNKTSGFQSDKKTKYNLSIKRNVKKTRKPLKKFNSDVEISQIKMQSSVIQSVQIVSQASTEANQISSQATRGVERSTKIETNQRKRSLKPVENFVLKPKTLKKHTKSLSPKISEPYDNNLNVEISPIRIQSRVIKSIQVVSKSTNKVNQISPQATRGVERNINIKTNEQKRSLEPDENSVPKSKKKLTNHINPPFPKASGTYDNNLNVEMSPIRIQSSVKSIEVVSESKNEVNQISLQATRGVERNINTQTNEQKRSLEPDENSVPKPKKRLTNHINPPYPKASGTYDNNLKTKHAKPPSPKTSGPYDNKLKFTFNRNVSTYTVSVVSPSEPEQSTENINICCNNSHETINENSMKCNGLSCQKTMKLTADLNFTESDPISLPKVIASGDARSPPSPIPFSSIPDIQSTFVKHYNIVFDDKTDVLCVEMGYLLLQIIEEERNLTKIMEKPQPSHDLLLGSDHLQTAARTCLDALHQSKRKFIDNFSQVHIQINIGHVIGTQLKTVLLTAWFLKMFLSITTKLPDFMDRLNLVRIEALKLLSEETVKWPLISKTFIKDEYHFSCDCLLVLELIKDSLKDQNELTLQSKVGFDQTVDAAKPQTVTRITSYNEVLTLPKELQRLENSNGLEASFVVKNATETKATNCNGMSKADSNIQKTNLENHQELNSAIEYGLKKNGQNLTNPMPSVRREMHYQYEESPFLRAQSEKQYCSNYTLNSNTHIQPNGPYYPIKPSLQNHDTRSPSKHSPNQYHGNNQAHYQESFINPFKTTSLKISNGFHDSFCPTSIIASDSNLQKFPVIDGGGIEISSCPITINNYNITNFSPLSPELKSNYDFSSFLKI